MNLTDIKKELYKQKPTAELICIRGGIAHYDTTIRLPESLGVENKTIFFAIPVQDMGDADFTPTMDAKLLIRWITDFSLDV
jgi:hypothetical protein